MNKTILEGKQNNDVKQLCDIVYLWDEMSMEQKREAAFMLIERMKIDENNIIITWKYKI